MTTPTFATRDALKADLRERFSAISAILDTAAGDTALFPEGLPIDLDRVQRYARMVTPQLAPAAAAEPETLEQAKARLCTAVDAERDRRIALDFAHDFGTIPALNGAGDEIEAGVRHLQMRDSDRARWQALQGAALTAVVSGQPNAVLPMRAEDNWNIQTTATQVLAVLAAMTAHGASLLFFGASLKDAIRASEEPETVDIASGWPGEA